MALDPNTPTEIDFGRMVDALPGIVWTTLADGRSDFVNRSWQEYTGHSAQDSRGPGWQTAVHPDDLAPLLQSWNDIKHSGIAADIEGRMRRFDGEYRWFAFRASAFQTGGGHQRWCWLASYSDESPTTDGRLRRLFDMMPLQAGFLNSAGVLEYANLKSLEDFAMTFEQLAAPTTSGIIHADDLRVSHSSLMALLTKGKWVEDETRFLYPDGTYRWTRARCVPIRDAQGNVARYITCQVDVDDLKRAEALLAAEVKLLEMVARGEPLASVLETLRRHLEELCTNVVCSVLVVARDKQVLQVGSSPSLADAFHDVLDGKSIDGGNDPCSLAVTEKVRIIAANLADDLRWAASPWRALMMNLGFCSCTATPILSAQGGVSGVVAIYRSLPATPALQEQEEHLVDRFTKIAGIAIGRNQADTALQISERELRETLAQLSAGQRLSKTGSFTSDPAADRHRWSEEFYRIFEINPTMGSRIGCIRDRVHPDDLELFDAQIRRRIEGGDGDFTFRIVTPNDGLKYLRGVARRMDDAGERQIFMGTIQDITASMIAEESLRASEAEYRRANMQLMDAHRLSHTGSFIWDVAADSHTWTEEIYRLFEFDPAIKVNMRMMFKAIHPEDLPAVEKLLDHAIEGSDFDMGFRVVSDGGSVKHARVVGRRIGQSSERPVFMGALQDVTASKVAEEALNRARTELAHVARVATLNAMTASIAHEVNQPISGIMTNASTCVRMLSADPPNVTGAAETARRTIRDANRAAEVIKRLRAMFANKAPTQESVNLNDATREVIALSSTELQRSRAVLQTQFAEDLPAVQGDRIQLQQVILNLLLNAADAMSGVLDRPRALLIQTRVHDNNSVRLLVRDSGVGIDPLAAEKMFEAFYSTKPHGMGVGLAISRSIIESHEGRLWAVPNDGKGATFGFDIPGLSSATNT